MGKKAGHLTPEEADALHKAFVAHSKILTRPCRECRAKDAEIERLTRENADFVRDLRECADAFTTEETENEDLRAEANTLRLIVKHRLAIRCREHKWIAYNLDLSWEAKGDLVGHGDTLADAVKDFCALYERAALRQED